MVSRCMSIAAGPSSRVRAASICCNSSSHDAVVMCPTSAAALSGTESRRDAERVCRRDEGQPGTAVRSGC
eukprot:7368307-Prorocentrum_lima.AAC.1